LGETVEEAAARETWEEICLRVKIEKLVGIFSYADAGVVTIVYLGRVKKGDVPKPGIESQHVDIFSPSQIPWKKLAFRSTTEALRVWLRCGK
jgi:ADP-ribose pyrophosphatase YjhB (NUDIX family)